MRGAVCALTGTSSLGAGGACSLPTRESCVAGIHQFGEFLSSRRRNRPYEFHGAQSDGGRSGVALPLRLIRLDGSMGQVLEVWLRILGHDRQAGRGVDVQSQ